ncbi:hypothetical protein WJ92_19415 [Burkholderia ubonensis]|uniref:hypothetical protein n=1 Tax=Burkholderia ubonensis TaxID=101571 RepID=UPI000770DBB5|nr:hypothetical protein [Burkholderia ubonensis]KVP79831.1 hypothetical protein WJ92_19415 [Burkholderia ubonensis]
MASRFISSLGHLEKPAAVMMRQTPKHEDVKMIKVSLFAEQEREAKLDKMGNALSKLGEAVNRQLDCHGYIARGGQMIDASVTSRAI